MNKDQKLLEEAYQLIIESALFELTEREEEVLREVAPAVRSIISSYKQQLVDLLMTRDKPLSYRWDKNNSVISSLTAEIRNEITQIVGKHEADTTLRFIALSLHLAPFYDFDLKLDKDKNLLIAFQTPQQLFQMHPPKYSTLDQIEARLFQIFKDWTARKIAQPVTIHDKEYIERREHDLVRKHKDIERTKELSKDFGDLDVLKDF